MLSQLLSRFGLVKASRYQALEERTRKLERRIAALLQDQETAQNNVETSRKRVDELSKALRDAEKELRRRTSKVEKYREQHEQNQAKFRGAAEQEKRRRAVYEEQYAAELEAVKERMATAQREVVVAREHLMAVEVKLDILEGAANVLDSRTREVVARRDARTETTV